MGQVSLFDQLLIKSIQYLESSI